MYTSWEIANFSFLAKLPLLPLATFSLNSEMFSAMPIMQHASTGHGGMSKAPTAATQWKHRLTSANRFEHAKVNTYRTNNIINTTQSGLAFQLILSRWGASWISTCNSHYQYMAVVTNNLGTVLKACKFNNCSWVLKGFTMILKQWVLNNKWDSTDRVFF